MDSDIPTAKEARERQLAAMRDHHGAGRHTFDECGVCGWIAWTCTNHSLPDEIAITERSPEVIGCAFCRDVAQRSPELYRWALGVTAKLRRLIAEVDHAR